MRRKTLPDSVPENLNALQQSRVARPLHSFCARSLADRRQSRKGERRHDASKREAASSVDLKELLSGLLMVGIAAAFAWLVLRPQGLALGSARSMGPGYFPLMIAIILAGLRPHHDRQRLRLVVFQRRGDAGADALAADGAARGRLLLRCWCGRSVSSSAWPQWSASHAGPAIA